MWDITLNCGHCSVPFRADKMLLERLVDDITVEVLSFSYECETCSGINIFLQINEKGPFGRYKKLPQGLISVWPFLNIRPPSPSEVPSHIAEDYEEACLVLRISPKSSAALSRRCLQNLLRDTAKVKPSDLYTEIEEVINKGHLPSHIEESLHTIRQIGSFAAHPLKSKSTGEILPVEIGEAEWNLDTLIDLFDFYYVKPKKISKKREALNAKLSEAGKPPVK